MYSTLFQPLWIIELAIVLLRFIIDCYFSSVNYFCLFFGSLELRVYSCVYALCMYERECKLQTKRNEKTNRKLTKYWFAVCKNQSE